MLAKSAVALCLTLALVPAGSVRAQTPADMAAAVNKTCGVMSGAIKPDRQAIQLLLLLDGDLADANPIEIGLYRGVVRQCPKAYLAYEQRLRTHNPFANGSLVKQTPTQLTNGQTTLTQQAAPAEYPIRCKGTAGMATARDKTLVVAFARATAAAGPGLQAGQCSWLDRTLGPKEPATIDVPLASAAQARDGVAQINAGGTWTFWVVNAGNGSLRASAVAKGSPAKKP